MEKNECINCQHYEDCGRPDRPLKCMGYEGGKTEKIKVVRFVRFRCGNMVV